MHFPSMLACNLQSPIYNTYLGDEGWLGMLAARSELSDLLVEGCDKFVKPSLF